MVADRDGYSGYVAFGIAHEQDHGSKVYYDAFLGGVKDGEAYGASYSWTDEELLKVPEERYQVGETRDLTLLFYTVLRNNKSSNNMAGYTVGSISYCINNINNDEN